MGQTRDAGLRASVPSKAGTLSLVLVPLTSPSYWRNSSNSLSSQAAGLRHFPARIAQLFSWSSVQKSEIIDNALSKFLLLKATIVHASDRAYGRSRVAVKVRSLVYRLSVLSRSHMYGFFVNGTMTSLPWEDDCRARKA